MRLARAENVVHLVFVDLDFGEEGAQAVFELLAFRQQAPDGVFLADALAALVVLEVVDLVGESGVAVLEFALGG